jgi:hypothetical protein
MLGFQNRLAEHGNDMLLYKIATLLALIVTAVWAINKPAYDSIGAAVAALAAFACVFFVDQKNKSTGQSQEISSGGAGIQAGRDANNARINKKN